MQAAAENPSRSRGREQKIRVVVAKPGLDGHDRGAKIIARALRDAGMEVIYTGLHQTPEQIAETVIQEDADAIGLSILSGAHMTLVPRVVELLKEQGADDVVITVGGTIPADDVPELKKLGVSEVFTPGARHRRDRRVRAQRRQGLTRPARGARTPCFGQAGRDRLIGGPGPISCAAAPAGTGKSNRSDHRRRRGASGSVPVTAPARAARARGGCLRGRRT